MDIHFGKLQKRLLRLGIHVLRKKLGECATKENIHEDLMNAGNPIVSKLHNHIIDGGNKLEHGYQRETVHELGELLLWIVYHDTAYRDVFFWLVNDVLQHAEEYQEDLKPYLKDPYDWTVNTWVRSMEETRRLRREGKIPEYAKSKAEEIFTPGLENKKLKKFMREK
jgi:hypothetical protein